MGASQTRTGNLFTLKLWRATRIVLTLGLVLAVAGTPAHAKEEPVGAPPSRGEIPSVGLVTVIDGAIYADVYSNETRTYADEWLRLDADLSVTPVPESDRLLDEQRLVREKESACLPDAPDVCFRASPEYRWRVERTDDGGETWEPDLSMTRREYTRMITEIYGWHGWGGSTVQNVVVGTWGGELVVVASGEESGLLVKYLGDHGAEDGSGSWVRYTIDGFPPGGTLTPAPMPDDSPYDTADIRLVWLITLVVGSVFASLVLGATSVLAGSDRKHNARWRRGIAFGASVVVLGVILAAWSSQETNALRPATQEAAIWAVEKGMLSPPHWPFAVFIGGPVLIGLAYAAVLALGWHAGKGLVNRVAVPVLITAASGLAAWGLVGFVDSLGLTDAADRVMDLWWVVTLVLTVGTPLVVLRIKGSRTVEPTPAPVEESVSA